MCLRKSGTHDASKVVFILPHSLTITIERSSLRSRCTSAIRGSNRIRRSSGRVMLVLLTFPLATRSSRRITIRCALWNSHRSGHRISSLTMRSASSTICSATGTRRSVGPTSAIPMRRLSRSAAAPVPSQLSLHWLPLRVPPLLLPRIRLQTHFRIRTGHNRMFWIATWLRTSMLSSTRLLSTPQTTTTPQWPFFSLGPLLLPLLLLQQLFLLQLPSLLLLLLLLRLLPLLPLLPRTAMTVLSVNSFPPTTSAPKSSAQSAATTRSTPGAFCLAILRRNFLLRKYW